MSKIRVGVFISIRSSEGEVSFNSGRTVYDHLHKNIFDVVPLFQASDGRLFILPWRFLHRGKVSDFLDRLDAEADQVLWSQLSNIIDIVYSAGHGYGSEDGSLQGMLEFLKIPYVGSSIFSNAASFSKKFHDDLLESNGIVTPKSYCIRSSDSIDTLALDISFPLIVKPACGGSSLGMSLIKSENELNDAIIQARSCDTHIQDVLLQEYIMGMEFSCVLIQEKEKWVAFEPTEIDPFEHGFFDYTSKYMPGVGKKYTPARCSLLDREKIKSTAIKVAKVLEAESIVRVDGFLKEDGSIIIIDTNAFPGTAPSSFTFWQAAHYGLNQSEFINHLIFNTIEKQAPYLMDRLKEQKKMLSDKKKLKIGVLLGGDTNEREISLDSGRNVIYKLSALNKYSVDTLFVTKERKIYKISNRLLVKNSTQEIFESLGDYSHEVVVDDFVNYDFVFLGLHGGYGENGSMQGALDMLDIPYNGCGVLAASLCANKKRANDFLLLKGFDVPRHVYVDFSHNEMSHDIGSVFENKGLNFPIVAKPVSDGCSVGVSLCKNFDELLKSLKLIENLGAKGALCEEALDGMELTVGVIGNDNPTVLDPSYTPKKSSILSMTEKFLPGDGENITPAPLSEEDMSFVKEVIKKIYKVLQCSGYVRIDCFFQSEDISPTGERRLVFLECNTLPALTPATCLFHQAAESNMRPDQLLEKIIDYGFESRKIDHILK